MEAAKASSRSAEREISSAFFFCELFFLRLWCQKEKWLRNLGDLRAGEQGEHVDCERKFVRFRVVEDVDPYN